METENSDRARESIRIEAPSYGFSPKLISRESVKVMRARAGIILCYIAIGLVGLVSLIMIIYFFVATHSLKSLAQPLTEESLKIYKEARSAVVDDIAKVGNLFLGSVLLPILTLLLGYIFGSKEERAEANEED
jgi:hypothetical protein